jgi:3-isopropylmalate dehydrogenase
VSATSYRIVLLPGDGIGPEVTAAAEQALRGVASVFGHKFEFETHAIGGAALATAGVPLPPPTLDACLASDGILLGAVGDPRFDSEPPSRRPERALLDLRQALGAYANLRPVRLWPGLEESSPLKADVLAGTDFLVVRELTGGLYYATPRGFHADSAVNTLRYSSAEVERIAHVAFAEARRRRGSVTSVDKANVLEVSQLWRSVVTHVSREYPGVQLTHMYVDNCAMQIALHPSQFDVILTENLFGDILSDEGGAIAGSLGVLPSASIGAGPGLFEPVHGSAPTLAGLDVANPIGAIGSAALLLRHGLQLEREADALERACEETLAAGMRTKDLGGEARCSDVAAAVIRRLRSSPDSGADPRHSRAESQHDRPATAAARPSTRA